MRILILEDSQERREFFESIITGHVAVYTKSLDRAIALVRDRTFDVIFVDFDLEDGKNALPFAELTSSTHHDTVVIIHSENPKGVKTLQTKLPNSVAIPFSNFRLKYRKVNSLKQILANPASLVLDVLCWRDNDQS